MLMDTQTQHKVLFNAVYKLLCPLVRLLLRNGVPFAAFADLAKRAYVDVATDDFCVPGRKQSNSRVATITGLSRKEVHRVKALDPSGDASAVERHNRAARVVYGWVHDERFADETGQAAILALEGEGASFTRLVKAYSGDVPPRAILDELTQVGIVEQLDDGRLRLLARAYIPKTGEAEKLRILGTDVQGLVSTIDRNIYSNNETPFFQRKVFYDNLSIEATEELRAMLAEQGQTLLEQFDRWMAARDRDVNPEAGGKGRRAAGIGIYYFEDKDFEENA